MKWKIVFIIGISILIAFTVLFVVSTSGFQDCMSPDDYIITNLEANQHSVRISGRIYGSVPSYKGYRIKLENGVMYFGIKSPNFFGENANDYKFDFDIPVNETVTKIILKSGQGDSKVREIVIYENGEVKIP